MEQWKGRIPSLFTVVLFIFIPIPATLSHCQQVVYRRAYTWYTGT
jgi:hypothetical protein